MTLNKWHAEQISKYSFIDKAEIKNAKLNMYYNVKGEQRHKHLPLRATTEQLQKTIKIIHEEIGVSKYGKGLYGAIFTSAD